MWSCVDIRILMANVCENYFDESLLGAYGCVDGWRVRAKCTQIKGLNFIGKDMRQSHEKIFMLRMVLHTV